MGTDRVLEALFPLLVFPKSGTWRQAQSVPDKQFSLSLLL